MIRNRNTHKPSDEFVQSFKSKFHGGLGMSAGFENAAPLNNAGNSAVSTNNHLNHFGAHQYKDADPTPRGSSEAWDHASDLPSSILEQNNHLFNSSFDDQFPDYYAPTLDDPNMPYHGHHEGDPLMTGYAPGLRTPISLPTSNGMTGVGEQLHTAPMQAFGMQAGMRPMNPHSQSMHASQAHHIQQTFAPQQFHQHSAPFESMGNSLRHSQVDDMPMDAAWEQSPGMYFNPQLSGPPTALVPHARAEKLRYLSTLNAPTAMTKTSDEIPTTYLNKGQAYTLNVVDTAPVQSMLGPLKYRTFIRISFDEDRERQDPGTCWQLWSDGRGGKEAERRGGRMHAVEFVDPSQANSGPDDTTKQKIELEYASFDGFCVTWTPGANGAIECPIPVRFNFLSTDFSHAKGVKGVALRLCAKTELLLDSMSPQSTQQPAHEICYCTVKVYRDHGAERKLSNDEAHVKKAMTKISERIAEIERGVCGGKRKRGNSSSGQKPVKLQKHHRHWSVDSAAMSGARVSAKDDELMAKQQEYNDYHAMLMSSKKTSSVLFLRGTDEDDPDLHPVSLREELQDSAKKMQPDMHAWTKHSEKTGGSPSVLSPTPSSRSSLPSQQRTSSEFLQRLPPNVARYDSYNLKTESEKSTTDMNANPQMLASPMSRAVTRVPTHTPGNDRTTGWIEALDVNPAFHPLPRPTSKPAACFFIHLRTAERSSTDQLYRAIYPMQRSLPEFVGAAARKCDINPAQVLRTVRISNDGIRIALDDDMIRNMANEQAMVVEFSEITAVLPPRTTKDDSDLFTDNKFVGFELKLHY